MPVFRTTSANHSGHITLIQLMVECLDLIATKGGMQRIDLRTERLVVDKLLSLGSDPLVAVHISYTEAQECGYVDVPSYQGAGAEAVPGAQLLGGRLDQLGDLLEKQVLSEKAAKPNVSVYIPIEARWRIVFRWAQKAKPQQQWEGTVFEQAGIDEAFELLATSIIEARNAMAAMAAKALERERVEKEKAP